MNIKKFKLIYLITVLLFLYSPLYSEDPYEPVLYRWEPAGWDNFGDALSQPIVERILGRKVQMASTLYSKKLLALGSILHSAINGDVVWGSGIMTGWHPDNTTELDVRAVKGPLTREILRQRGIECPPVYGDPALLIPLLFPEFQPNPIRDYIIIPHASETHLFLENPNFVSPKEPWQTVVQKITESKFVIASSLHGIIVAEAFGIPARMLMCTNQNQFFKYQDYYFGTGRLEFKYATSVEEALSMGGESPMVCDLDALLDSFPFDFWECSALEVDDVCEAGKK